MINTAIKVDALSKQYRIGAKQDGYQTLRESLTDAARLSYRRLASVIRRGHRDSEDLTFWALKDVSFEIEAGDVVGIVGSNGAGKSTLLKMLSRIVDPTSGTAEIRGRVGSLLEVGTGFHPELTGRENIFLNGVILGMKRPEIIRKFDEIVAFAEIDQFIDTPVKRYSSGMYVRLAFAVAAHLEAEILLVDEVLAVGDAVFQRKCLGAMGNVAKQGRTVVFVSHNMGAMAALCKRCFLIDKGRLSFTGPPNRIIEEYLSRTRESASHVLSERKDRHGNGRLLFTAATLLDHRMEPVDCVTSGQNVTLCLDYELPAGQNLEAAYVQISFAGSVGQPLFMCLSRISGDGFFTLRPEGRIFCHIPKLPLVAGVYTYSVWCKSGQAPGVMEDSVENAGTMVVLDGDFYNTRQSQPKSGGDFLVNHQWTVEDSLGHTTFPGALNKSSHR